MKAGRAEDKFNTALLRLELMGRAFESAGDADERRARLALFETARQEALRARWELMIQRETVGIRRNDALERLYPIPPRRGDDEPDRTT